MRRLGSSLGYFPKVAPTVTTRAERDPTKLAGVEESIEEVNEVSCTTFKAGASSQVVSVQEVEVTIEHVATSAPEVPSVSSEKIGGASVV